MKFTRTIAALGAAAALVFAGCGAEATNPGEGMAEDLAQELGLDASKVQSALDELKPQGRAPDRRDSRHRRIGALSTPAMRS